MQVKAFKLNTGDEIIAYAEPAGPSTLIDSGVGRKGAEFNDPPSPGWRLHKVRAVQLTANPHGGIGFVLMPWVACNPDMELVLPPSMIAFEVTPLKGIEDSYVAQTSVVKPASTIPQGIIGT